MKKIFIVFLVSCKFCFGQSLINQIPPSPNAASLGKFGNLSQSLNSGNVNYSIPLFELSEFGLNQDVSLNYNYNGYKPSELEGIVGRGWTLNAGGVITRAVNGKKDESLYGYYNIAPQIKAAAEQFQNYGTINNDLLDVITGIKDGEPDIFYFNFGKYSGSFFWGEDGQFHLNSQEKIKIEFTYSVDPPIRDMVNQAFVQDNFIEFKLTCEDGTVYIFNSCEYSRSNTKNLEDNPSNEYRAQKVISAWYLTTIVGSSGQKINFNYTVAPEFANRFQASYLENHGSITGPSFAQSSAKNEIILNLSYEIFLSSISGTGWELLLNYESFNDPSAAGYSSSSKRLIDISLYDKSSSTSNFIKSYELTYFDAQNRFWPETLTQLGRNQNELPPYKFSYYGFSGHTSPTRALDHFGFYNGQIGNNTLIPDLGANRNPSFIEALDGALRKIEFPTGGISDLVYEQNDYGYKRGSLQTATLTIDSTKHYEILNGNLSMNPGLFISDTIAVDIEITATNVPLILSCDDPVHFSSQIEGYNLVPKPGNAAYMIVDFLQILGAIGYCVESPDPQSSDWQNAYLELRVISHHPYETHKIPGPGVRIKSITNSQVVRPDPPVVTSFEYWQDSLNYSSGEILSVPFYGVWTEHSNSTYFISSNPFNSISLSPINYLEVKEKKNGQLSKNHYFTSHKEDFFSDEFGIPLSGGTDELGPVGDFAAMRGRLKQEVEYGDNEIPLSVSFNNYHNKSLYIANSSPFYTTTAIYNRYFTSVPNTNNSETPVTYNKIYYPSSFWFYPKETKVVTYDELGLNPVSTTTELFYENEDHYQLTLKKTTNSEGTIELERYKYPLDYSSVINKDPMIDSLIDNHRINDLIEHTTSELRNNQAEVVLDATVNTYALFGGNNSKDDLFLVNKVYGYQSDGTSFIPYSGTANGVSANSYYQNLEIVSYDTLGQALQTKDNSGLNVSVIRAYNARYPFAFILNAQKTEVDLALSNLGTSQNALRNESDNIALESVVNSLKVSLPNSMVKGYFFEPMKGLSYSLAPNGIETQFFYDDFNRLSNIRDNQSNILQAFKYQYQGDVFSIFNHIVTSTLTVPTSVVSDSEDYQKAKISYDFLNGFGAQWQSIAWRQSPLGFNILNSNVIRDSNGRVIKETLAGPTAEIATIPNVNPIAALAPFYDDGFAYFEKEYDGPSERIKSVRKPGEAWFVNSKKSSFETSTAGDSIRNYSIDVNNDITLNGFYPTNSLLKNISLDEQNQTIIEFLDRKGQLIEKHTEVSQNQYAVTHYIYNGISQLRAIIQPNGYELNSSLLASDPNFSNYVFCYVYDERNRLVKRHIPGAGWTFDIFDISDRPVLSQNAFQRLNDRWSFVKYDVHGREILRGEATNTNSQAYLQNEFSQIVIPYETRSSGSYTNTSFPSSFTVSESDILVMNFYDNWTNSAWAFNATEAYNSSSFYSNAQDLLTGSWSRKSETPTEKNYSVVYYDNKGRVLQSYQTHQKSGNNALNYIRKDFDYNFEGQVLREKTAFKVDGQSDIVSIQENEYDHAGRLLSVNHGIDNSPLLNIAKYKYDEGGRLIQKNILNPNSSSQGSSYIIRSSSPGSSQTEDVAPDYILYEVNDQQEVIFEPQDVNSYLLGEIGPALAQADTLQAIDFSYHISGSLLGINLDGSGNAVPDTSEGDLFAYKLEYETAGQWDGNIGKQSWASVRGNNNSIESRSYTFSYDPSKRLTAANYSGLATEDFTLPAISYDLNGNILSLQRNGNLNASNYGLMDNLSYTYAGNKLTAVTDAIGGDHTVDLVPRNGGGYTYWDNGALKSDANEQISLIDYDSFLNQPKQITLTDGRWIKYFYDGAGSLLKTEYSTGEYWEYIANIVYKNGQPYQLSMPEGRAIYSNTNWEYEFEYKGHLGNTRLSFDANGVAAISSFDPWGVRLNGIDSLNAFQNRWELQGKEKESTFGLNRINFGARNYNPTIGRFYSVDPLADKMPGWSPYTFSSNNPINRIDPDGNMDIPCCSGWIDAASKWLSDTFKGFDAGTNQRYQTEPARGATVTGVRDTQGGKIRNDNPVGINVIRVDKPHGSVKTPHINVNPSVTGILDPHTAISTNTLKTLEGAGKTLDAISKVAKPVAIATDAIRIGNAVSADGGTVGINTVRTGASIAGGWAGAYGGAALGAKGGAVVGSFFGPGPGTAIGGFVGGIGGGLLGAFGGSRLGEKAVETVIEKK